MVKKSTKSRKRNNLFIDILLAALGVGFIFALYGVYVYSNMPQGDAASSVVTGTEQEESNDLIIVMYRDGTSNERINEIIASVEGTVVNEYDQMSGYSIRVPAGTQERAVATLKTYDEVGSANISGTASAY